MDDYRFMSWHEMQQGDINADLLIMGNSRALSHFEPWTIDSICGTTSYNIGIGAYAITVEDFKYNWYRLYNKKPDRIVMQVDQFTLRNDSAPHRHQSEQFLPLIYDRRFHDEMRRVGYGWMDLHCPLYRYWGYQMVIKNGLFEYLGIKHYVTEPSRRGLHYETAEWDGTELAAMDTLDAMENISGKEYFEGFMQKCTDEGVNVLLVNSPIYAAANLKTKRLDALDAYYDSIAKVHNTEYWNYNDGYELCNDTSNFVVSMHMNPSAAHRFSIDFANKYRENMMQ